MALWFQLVVYLHLACFTYKNRFSSLREKLTNTDAALQHKYFFCIWLLSHHFSSLSQGEGVMLTSGRLSCQPPDSSVRELHSRLPTTGVLGSQCCSVSSCQVKIKWKCRSCRRQELTDDVHLCYAHSLHVLVILLISCHVQTGNLSELKGTYTVFSCHLAHMGNKNLVYKSGCWSKIKNSASEEIMWFTWANSRCWSHPGHSATTSLQITFCCVKKLWG